MRESWPYRTELLMFSESFARRAQRQFWRDDSLSKAEKMLFTGFFFIRKLVECDKVTDRCARSSTVVSRGPIKRGIREVSAFMRDDLFDDLNQVEWETGKIDVVQLADKVIHTWWIIPIKNEASGLGGFIFTTDKHRNKELWMLSTPSIVDVFGRFGRSVVREMQSERDENGRLTYRRAE